VPITFRAWLFSLPLTFPGLPNLGHRAHCLETISKRTGFNTLHTRSNPISSLLDALLFRDVFALYLAWIANNPRRTIKPKRG
jgi:hypothetical protein